MSGMIMKLAVAVLIVAALAFLGRIGAGKTGTARSSSNQSGTVQDASGPWQSFEKPNEENLRSRLNNLQFRVTQNDGTERPFQNEYWDNHADGIYVDIVSGEPLFSSLDKFDSGTGWPSFTRPLLASQVTERSDVSLGMRRVEVRSKQADSHLGHLFEDGPAPTGLRYCINSASLRFVPVGRLAEEGYGDFLALFQPETATSAVLPEKTEVATLAGGCFWGMEDIIRDIPGVLDTDVGYTGGVVKDATYKDVRTGRSGHAESVRIVFDPDKISYAEILGYFFRMHDPTTENRQGNDRGTQYRSVIFYHDETQRETAERVAAEVDASGKWKNPIVTELTPAGEFYLAEEYHQDYLEKNPNGYTCHFLRD